MNPALVASYEADAELRVSAPREEREMDIENYRNYLLVKFRDRKTKQTWSFPKWPGKDLDISAIQDFIKRYTLVTFNGNNYDIPILSLALTGADNNVLKDAGDAIIRRGVKPWQFYDLFRVRPPAELDHIDLFEVAPGVGISLKMYMGRQHSRQMQDLPIDPDSLIDPLQRVTLDTYCGNDLEGTGDLREQIDSRLELRRAISKTYGVDVRSKSDAQIAEAVIKAKLSFRPDRRYIQHGYSFQYQAPAYLSFKTPTLQRVLEVVTSTPFVVEDKEQAEHYYGKEEDGSVVGEDGKKITTGVKLPTAIRDLQITIGNSVYQMGIGGLHSTESASVYYTIPGVCEISDHDVGSYYPTLIKTLGIFPEQLTKEFLEIYEAIINRRLFCKAEAKRLARLLDEPLNHVELLFQNLQRAAKEAKTEAEGLKIVLNGTFGKLFSKYSILFYPEHGIKVTLTGQLDLFMLIEALELAGIQVVSANTDGIVLRTPWHMRTIRDTIIKEWQARTGLETEATFYSAIYSRDVNNYLAFKMNGMFDGKVVQGSGHKGKGVYAESGVLNNKHPDADISQEAVISYLSNGTPIERTIRTVTDVRKLLVIRAVRGGGWYQPKAYAELPKMRERVKSLILRLGREVIKGSASNMAKRELLTAELLELQSRTQAMEESELSQRIYLGKAVRWYHGTNREARVVTGKGHLVATSEGAHPAMRLPDSLPPDVDYDWYIDHAKAMMADLGLKYACA